MVLAPRAIALMFPGSETIGAVVEEDDEKKGMSLDSESDDEGFEKGCDVRWYFPPVAVRMSL